eukprot:Skav202346  [mRNA]  locus=scaffold2638:172757:173811:+ [translate_table: standard]
MASATLPFQAAAGPRLRQRQQHVEKAQGVGTSNNRSSCREAVPKRFKHGAWERRARAKGSKPRGWAGRFQVWQGRVDASSANIQNAPGLHVERGSSAISAVAETCRLAPSVNESREALKLSTILASYRPLSSSPYVCASHCKALPRPGGTAPHAVVQPSHEKGRFSRLAALELAEKQQVILIATFSDAPYAAENL